MSSDQQSSANGQVQVDTDRLQQGADALEGLAARLTTAGERFWSDSNAQGQAWGDNDDGKKFFAQYKKPHSDAVDAGEEGGTALDDAAKQLRDLVATLTALEQQAAATGRKLTFEPTNGG
ncbi:hypothetical protein [Streptantibioticus ferralitis]|uniref:WXG100 family type VII secretion target n=1 Tax=Streptantibioticus ferralitis TaxID=236510 RepID=A0ABT5Z4L2_9ACTN|nr:hypothetical protein [Streptantibioticus ferralitis]MDF2258770.1 hypothetical protein [Streptantibioticus ferralitis]